MALINKNDIEKLLNVQNNTKNALCISIYIPTHRSGKETLNGQDHILFKNKIKEAKALLARHDVPEAEIEEYMKPAEALLNDNNFWRHQAEGLAVFITKGFSTHYTVPVEMPDVVYVLDHFYFTPMLPILSQNGRFFILCLYREKIGFFEATLEKIRPIDISSFVPETMNKALKFDIKGNDQDFTNSTTTVNGSNIVHGPGSTKGDEEHERVREFMLEIDNSLQQILHNESEPLVLAGVDHYCGIYRNISKYKNIAPDNINVNENADISNINNLHEKALRVVKPMMQQNHTDSLNRYQNVAGTGVTSEDIATVAAEAVHGRIDTLFIAPSEPVWGSYDAKSATAEIHDNYQRGDHDLINLAATKTLAQGGKVFVSSYGGMNEVTDGRANVKALFRY
ncbi:baeRF7 domain-containing protein [Pontibacter sp. MBLB2868]|uniref:baeRF7 domain-containing protein n=1 Tax=Pontibacter sp. MBLB2868 TaxID=3451555 RepID=UPI003F7513B1